MSRVLKLEQYSYDFGYFSLTYHRWLADVKSIRLMTDGSFRCSCMGFRPKWSDCSHIKTHKKNMYSDKKLEFIEARRFR